MHLLLKELLPHSSVHCTERVIQEIDVCIMIHSSGQVHPGLLSSTQGHTPLTHQCQVTIHQDINILHREQKEFKLHHIIWTDSYIWTYL